MPCVVRYRWDRVRYYNEFCNDGKSFCYWYVAYVGGERVWKLLHKDCECPCDCEDPERVGYNKHNLQVFSDECPNYLTPDRGLGDVSELPEDLQKEKLPSTHFVKTKCAYAIKDCKIRFEPRWVGWGTFYFPEFTYQYHDKLPCIYIRDRLRACTDQKIFQCDVSPGYENVTYKIDPIPYRDFPELNLWGEVPCNIEVRCDRENLSCNFTRERAWDYFFELWPFFRNTRLLDETRTRLYLPVLRPEIRALLQPFLPAPVQIDGPPIYYQFGSYDGISYLAHWRMPPAPSRSETRPENPPAGSCLYIITSTGEKYVYHTCSEGWRCPEINWRRREKGCPEKDYIITITDCEYSREESTTTTTTTLEPLFPFCSWESVPLRATFTYDEIGEPETHGGGFFVKRTIQEVREAKYYDILLDGGYAYWGNKLVLYDRYGFRFFWQEHCGFSIWNPYYEPDRYPMNAIQNDKNGNVKAIYLNISSWREDVPIPTEVIEQAWKKHLEKCGSTPNCYTVHGGYSYRLEEHNKRDILPILESWHNLHAIGGAALRTYGFSYISGGWYYLFDPSLFAAGPERYCKLTYNGYTWVASGTCNRCDIYIEMLNHIMKVCFRKKIHNLIERRPSFWNWKETKMPFGIGFYSLHYFLPNTRYERVGSAYFEASKYTCECTVGDVVRFLNQIRPFEIYLTCPLDLPDSDYFYIKISDHRSPPTVILPCGAYKAIPYPNIDVARFEEYIIPCTQSRNVECEPQNARRIFWAFVPWVYQPCLCRERTSS